MIVMVSYSVSVSTSCGWRQVTVTARAEVISPKRVRILTVETIGGEIPHYRASRTGARRQQYNAVWAAANEIGKTKNRGTLLEFSKI